jgi:hypothetical protein
MAFRKTAPLIGDSFVGNQAQADTSTGRYEHWRGRHPLVMWHGCLSPAWEATPDGREGFQPIFVRRGWQVYVIDQPRSGRGLERFTGQHAGLTVENMGGTNVAGP